MTEETERQSKKKGAITNVKSITREKIEETKKKCLKIVENLLEPSVSEDLLINLCGSISQDDYLDVVEERNILLLCGYPLCSKTVKPTKQKYHISVKTSKVYDVTERKCFCSNVCYKASNFLKAQLSACPIWLKDKDAEDKHITLLSTAKNCGSAGEEVDLGHKRMTENDIEWIPDKESTEDLYSSFMSDDLDNFTTVLGQLGISENPKESQNMHSTERKLYCFDEKDQDGGDDAPKLNDDHISLITEKYVEDPHSKEHPITEHPYLDSDDDDCTDISVEHTKYESLISNNKYMPVVPKVKVRKALLIDPVVNNPDCVSMSPLAIKKINNSLKHVHSVLMSWITADTFHIILGENRFESVKSEILENAAETSVPNVGTNSADQLEAMRQKLAKIYLKLEKEEVVELESKEKDGHEDENLGERNKDLDKLKSTSKKKAGKKSKSTPGKNARQEPSGKCPVRRKEMEPVPPSTSRDICVLPVVESVSQSIIRRQIVADHLKIVYVDILPSVGLYYRDISEDFRILISTFNLSSTNISFKPHEWKMIAVILFRMIEKNLATEKVWNQEKCWALLKAKLVSFDISLNQIDAILTSVTNLNHLKALLLGY